ncbi:MAG: metal ABC transporter permease [Thermoplasmata archaeon]|nr:metal ABC transporter permease [Thermoplasmata archaeon]
MWDLLGLEYMQNALIAGLLASVACGIIGTYVVVKRIVFISGGISHASFGGIGIARFLGFEPMIGALIFALASALGIGVMSRKGKQREDTSIGILWVVGMAIGFLFLQLTPGYGIALESYLFGNILMVTRTYIYYILALDIAVIVIMGLLYKEMMATTFDEEYAEVSTVPTGLIYMILLSLVAITVVTLIKIVGVILVIALLTIPPALSGKVTHNIKRMITLSILLGMGFVVAGLWVSAYLDLRSGATIVILAGAVLLFVNLYEALENRLSKRGART